MIRSCNADWLADLPAGVTLEAQGTDVPFSQTINLPEKSDEECVLNKDARVTLGTGCQGLQNEKTTRDFIKQRGSGNFFNLNKFPFGLTYL